MGSQPNVFVGDGVSDTMLLHIQRHRAPRDVDVIISAAAGGSSHAGPVSDHYRFSFNETEVFLLGQMNLNVNLINACEVTAALIIGIQFALTSGSGATHATNMGSGFLNI